MDHILYHGLFMEKLKKNLRIVTILNMTFQDSVCISIIPCDAVNVSTCSHFLCNCFVHSINSASPRSHAVRPEKDNLYGSYSIDQVHGQPSGSASPPELFRQVGSWAGGGSRADVACDTGKFFITHVPFSKLC